MEQQYMSEKIREHDEKLKEHDKIYKSINSLAIELNKIAEEIKYICKSQEQFEESQAEQNRRLNDLESKPVKRYDNVINFLTTTIVGLILGYIFSKIGLK